MKERYIENKYVQLWFEGGILVALYTTPNINLEIAKECLALRLEHANFKDYPVFVDMRQIKSTNKDARDYLASDEGYKYINSCALLIDSPVTKYIGNFFMRLSKPKAPTKIFTDKKKAMKWLRQFELTNPVE